MVDIWGCLFFPWKCGRHNVVGEYGREAVGRILGFGELVIYKYDSASNLGVLEIKTVVLHCMATMMAKLLQCYFNVVAKCKILVSRPKI